MVLIRRTRVLTLERREFCARIFCFVLTVDDAMGEFLELRIALPDVLLKACDPVVGNF